MDYVLVLVIVVYYKHLVALVVLDQKERFDRDHTNPAGIFCGRIQIQREFSAGIEYCENFRGNFKKIEGIMGLFKFF